MSEAIRGTEELTIDKARELMRESDFKDVFERQIRIEKLEQEAMNETYLEDKLLKYKRCLDLSKEQLGKYMEIVSTRLSEANQALIFSQESADKIAKVNRELRSIIIDEREQNKEFFEVIMVGMVKDPIGSMELLLSRIEREEKKADCSGRAWEWNYKFPLKFRLLMALRLIFGKLIKNKELAKDEQV